MFNKLIIIPDNEPIIYNINIIFKFSFLSLLFLSNTNNPTPADGKSPATAVPSGIISFINSVVINNDAEQLGIKPTKEVIKGANNVFDLNIFVK